MISKTALLQWSKRVVGVCSLGFALLFGWLFSVFLRDTLYDPYQDLTLVIIALLGSVGSGFLLFGSAGLALLTGRFRNARRTLYQIWLVLGVLTVVLFLLVLSTVPTP